MRSLMVITLFLATAFTGVHASEYHLRPRPSDTFPIPQSADTQLWTGDVNRQLINFTTNIGGLQQDVKDLRRDVDKQSVIVSIVTFTAQTGGVVILTFFLTTVLQMGRARLKTRSDSE